jgi:spermidine synthase
MPPVVAGFVVFAASAAVLVLEILAGRLLAPYVGVTLQTYTGIIGTVLAGIAVGSWYGGKMADRHDPRGMLGPLIIAGGILALLAIPAVTFVGAALQGGGTGPVVIVALSLVGFFAPAAVLSAVTPTVVKLQLASLDETGQIVGRLSALSTTGAIFGTFVTGFLLVAALPSRPTVLGLGAGLILGGLVLWWWLRPRRGRARPAVALVVLALGATGLTLGLPYPCEYESAYFCARVVADEERDTGRVLVLDTLRHSYVDVEDPTYLGFGYMEIFGDVLSTVGGDEPIDVLHVGGGGFTMPQYLEAQRPGTRNVVLEIDPMLVQIAEDELGLSAGPDLDVRTGDARLGVELQPAATFDAVIGDAFGGLAVPWHLTTVEFVEEIRASLGPDGLYMINVIDYPPMGFARAKAATLVAVFDHVAAVAPPARFRGSDGGNIVLLGADDPIDVDGIRAAIEARGGDVGVITGDEVNDFAGSAPVLTDDYAPVDQLLTTPG